VVAVVFDQPVEGSVRQGDNSPSVVSCATRFAREKASARVPLRRPELADGWLHDVKPPRSLPIPLPFHNRSYVRTWTAEFARRGIRANVISPGPIETAILDGQFSTKEAADAFRQQFKANIPLGRIGLPEEVASAALFLASNESSYISGIGLPVDAAWCRSEIPGGLL